MHRMTQKLMRFGQIALIASLALVVYFSVSLAMGEPTVHALPEYSPQTGEPCATCHVSAGGGGPRTLRGLLWAARGRPDEVPDLPGNLIAPGVEAGVELYDIACAGCHGSSGEGLFGINLAQRDISMAAVRTFIRQGIPELGMPAFDGQFTPEQLETLSEFVTEMGTSGGPPEEYPLPAPLFECMSAPPAVCGGK